MLIVYLDLLAMHLTSWDDIRSMLYVTLKIWYFKPSMKNWVSSKLKMMSLLKLCDLYGLGCPIVGLFLKSEGMSS